MFGFNTKLMFAKNGIPSFYPPEGSFGLGLLLRGIIVRDASITPTSTCEISLKILIQMNGSKSKHTLREMLSLFGLFHCNMQEVNYLMTC